MHQSRKPAAVEINGIGGADRDHEASKLREVEAGVDAGAPAVVEPVRPDETSRAPCIRIEALEDSVVLEVSALHLDDVVRMHDRYGQTCAQALGSALSPEHY